MGSGLRRRRRRNEFADPRGEGGGEVERFGFFWVMGGIEENEIRRARCPGLCVWGLVFQ